MEQHRGLYKFTDEPKIVNGEIWFRWLGKNEEGEDSYVSSSLYSRCLICMVSDIKYDESPSNKDILIIPEEML